MNDLARAVSDAVGAFIEAWGFRAIHGRVWAILAIRAGPLSQTEIAQFLGVSRSLVNLAIGELETYGLVRPLGSQRNAPYEARMDVWPTITEVLRRREWMLMERARVALEAALQESEWCQDHNVETWVDDQRLKLLLRMTEFAQLLLKTVLGVRIPRALDELGGWLQTMSSHVRRLKAAYGVARRFDRR